MMAAQWLLRQGHNAIVEVSPIRYLHPPFCKTSNRLALAAPKPCLRCAPMKRNWALYIPRSTLSMSLARTSSGKPYIAKAAAL